MKRFEIEKPNEHKFEPINPDIPADFIEFANDTFKKIAERLEIPREILKAEPQNYNGPNN